ncbi:MAG: LTA synthase family protein [Eubacterium sp.]|nr:LTA synthase family protein [Eubacterium sp.]MCM1409235.1 LTA synthase family protein [Lachnospiraceae bacterium]
MSWGGAERKPNIIMVMNEAWSDLRVLAELDMTGECMPFMDSLTENTLRGNLYVSILGGTTANTEFEALTGNSLSLLAPVVVPYLNQVDHDMPSLARVLEAQGYETMAMHPSGESAWNRGKVYTYFGFDTFIHQGKWDVPFETIRAFASDACNYDEIIYRYERRNRDVPFFLFDVTIQNHGGYYGDVPMDIGLTRVGGVLAEEAGDLYDAETYLNLIKISDDAFKELVAYFEQVEDPVIICMFGDHQPLLGDDFYEAAFAGQSISEEEKNLKKYIVPYVIWANYDVDWKEYGDMSANYLPAVLTECAGLQMPPFYQYLTELREEYPVLTRKGCLDKEGKQVNITDIQEHEWIRKYRMLQYNQLYEKDYISWIFEGTAAGV